MSIADPTRSKHRGNPESVAAYRDSCGHHQSDRELILDLIRFRGSLTCDEACIAIERQPTPNDISGRFKEMSDAGLIVRNGETRLTRKNCKAAVWVLAPPPGQLF